MKLSGLRTTTLKQRPVTFGPTPWLDREGHAVTKLTEKSFLVMGGEIMTDGYRYGLNLMNDIWIANLSWPVFSIVIEKSIFDPSRDAPIFQSTLNWQNIKPQGIHWSKRSYHASVFHNGKIYVLGGLSLDSFHAETNEQHTRLKNDIWSSEDMGKT